MAARRVQKQDGDTVTEDFVDEDEAFEDAVEPEPTTHSTAKVTSRAERRPSKLLLRKVDAPVLNPKRQGVGRKPGEPGVSKWVKILQDIVDNEGIEQGDWIVVQESPNPTGANSSMKTLRKGLESDNSPAPEGTVWDIATRRVDIDADGEWLEYGSDPSLAVERHSLLYLRYADAVEGLTPDEVFAKL